MLFRDLPTLRSLGVYDALLLRLRSLTPNSVRLWGTMPVGGMLCHLDDAFTRMLHPDIPSSTAASPASWPGRVLIRPLALHAPLRWARNMPTVPQVDQRRGGTPPTTFAADQAKVLVSLPRFFEHPSWEGHPHPIMGPLTHWEWSRWAWLHTDHHLRQFSA